MFSLKIEVTPGSITLSRNAEGMTALHSEGLLEVCKECGGAWCADEEHDDKEEHENRIAFNHALDGIEALVLGCFSAGIDCSSPEFQEAVETAYQALGQNFS